MLIDEVLKEHPDKLKPDAVIKVQNVADYVYAVCDKNEKAYFSPPSLLPPFKNTWFEFNAEYNSTSGRIIKMPFGFYVNYGEMGIKADGKKELYEKYFKDKKFYSIAVAAIHKDPDMGIIINGLFSICTDIYGRMINGDTYLPQDPDKLCEMKSFLMGKVKPKINEEYAFMYKNQFKTDSDINNILMGNFQILLAIFNFLHCKNVTVTQNKIPEKLIHARKRRGKPYFEKFYTLEIEPMKKILNASGANRESGLQYAFHLCRGHFKTYTDKNPLFGRLTGTYWWHDMARGNKKIGAITKDYSINT